MHGVRCAQCGKVIRADVDPIFFRPTAFGDVGPEELSVGGTRAGGRILGGGGHISGWRAPGWQRQRKVRGFWIVQANVHGRQRESRCWPPLSPGLHRGCEVAEAEGGES